MQAELFRSFIVRAWLGVGMSLAFVHVSEAQSAMEKGSGTAKPGTVDCTQVSIDHVDDPTLTRAEKIGLMDRALLNSLSKFDSCQTSQTSSKSNNSGADTNGLGGAGGYGSVASSDISGTEKAPAAAQPKGLERSVASTEAKNDGRQQANADPAAREDKAQVSDNGKMPEDIPPAENDSILEAQIRQAAINEKNADIRKKLWNEYRKYKGLPQVR